MHGDIFRGEYFDLIIAAEVRIRTDAGYDAAFGKVTAGIEVVDAICKVKTNRQDRPLEEQKIASITVEVNGAELAELKKLPDPYGRF